MWHSGTGQAWNGNSEILKAASLAGKPLHPWKEGLASLVRNYSVHEPDFWDPSAVKNVKDARCEAGVASNNVGVCSGT